VIRDHSSKFLIACNQRIDEITMPELVEALAARSVVALVREEGLINIILASNRLSFCGSVH
jgi:SUMO ligase MMS21 Smc5/6 complex component